MDKLLSVIVPSYNMEKYLPKCLDSLIVDDAELLQRLDIIVVNDGSKDRTSEIAHKFKTKHPGVFRVIDKANGNYGSCINAALPVAEGRFVKILDADDTFDTAGFKDFLTRLNKLADTLQTLPDMILSPFVWVDQDGHELKKTVYDFATGTNISVDSLHSLPLIFMHGVTYRTSLLQDARYVQTEGISYTDNEWVCYPLSQVAVIRHEDTIVYRYLYGRPDQTMAAAKRKKDLWMRGVLAQRMANDYCTRDFSGLPRIISDYIRNFETMTVAQVYDAVILDYPSKSLNEYLIEFDDFIAKRSPILHDVLLNSVLFSHKINFHYGKEWLRYKRPNTGKLFAYRIYRNLSAGIIKIMRGFK